jgi:hypothetical protein
MGAWIVRDSSSSRLETVVAELPFGERPADFGNGAGQQARVVATTDGFDDSQTLADGEQTLAEIDQTLADADQTAADSDR